MNARSLKSVRMLTIGIAGLGSRALVRSNTGRSRESFRPLTCSSASGTSRRLSGMAGVRNLRKADIAFGG